MRSPRSIPAPEPPPTPCARAGSLRAAALRAFEEGHVLRAARVADQAAALCPTDAREGWEIAYRAALALGDVTAAEAVKQKVLAAPDAPPALRFRVTRFEEPTRDDAREGLAPSTDEVADYRHAAVALLAGRHDEATQLGLRVALAHGKLQAEAFVLAATAARAAGQEARANRLEARAFRAACPDDCAGAAVSPPRDDLFAVALLHPGLMPMWPGCVHGSIGSKDSSDPTLLTADGAFWGTIVPRGVLLRSVPYRVLVSSIEPHGQEERLSYVACFSEGAAQRLLYVHASPGTLQIGPLDGELRDYRLRPGVGFNFFREGALLTATGNAFFADDLDSGPTLDGYLVNAHDRTVKRVFRPPQVILGVYPGGDLLGFEGVNNGPRPLTRFDGMTGKVVARLGTARGQYPYCVVTRDERRLFCADGGEVAVIDIATGATRSNRDVHSPIGVLGSSRLLFEDVERHRWIEDFDTGTRTRAPTLFSRTVGEARVTLSGPFVLVHTPGAVEAIDLAHGTLTRIEGAAPTGRVVLSDDARWLAAGYDADFSLYDVRDPRHAELVWRGALPPISGAYSAARPLSFLPRSDVLVARSMRPPFSVRLAYDATTKAVMHLADDRPPSSVARPVPPCKRLPFLDKLPGYPMTVMGPSGAALYQCDDRIWRDHPDTQAAAEILVEHGIFEDQLHLEDWDERTGTLVLAGKDRLVIARPTPDRRLRGVTLWLADDANGAFARDGDGHYALLGDASAVALLRDSATCADGLPLRVCADRWEDPALLAQFLTDDPSGPSHPHP